MTAGIVRYMTVCYMYVHNESEINIWGGVLKINKTNKQIKL